jgi:hypothetical protein
MITVFDVAGDGSAKACWALMRRASAHSPESDKFESASSSCKTSLLQGIMSCRSEKPDMYWSAPRTAESPVISVAEIGYVRRSELKPVTILSVVIVRVCGRSSNHRTSGLGRVCLNIPRRDYWMPRLKPRLSGTVCACRGARH